MRVSIIIPVYNQERFLEAALSDALGQDYEDVEVVAVNDGSTDSSGLILKRFSDADDRLKVINKSNGGLVTANSAGIKAASGEYVCFLDSDDYIGTDFVSSFVQELDQPYDFIAKGFQFVELDGNSKPFLLKENHVFAAGELRALTNHYLMTAGDSIYVSRWNKMYRKSVLLSFVDEYAACGRISLCEDVVFTYLLLQHANNGKSCVEISSYHYCVHEYSMSHYFDFDRLVNELNMTFDVFKAIIDRYSRDLTPALLPYYRGLVGQLGLAIGEGDPSAQSIYSRLQNNKRFRESVASVTKLSKMGLSAEIMQAWLLYWRAPFWLYCFSRKVRKSVSI